MAAGIGVLKDEEYTAGNCTIIRETRNYTAEQLEKLGFILTDSSANFLFARHPQIGGEELYLLLKEKGILIRHFSKKEICEYNRITVGRKEDMDILIKTIQEILEERT
jgi:histidinol-phosphate aminotransferase